MALPFPAIEFMRMFVIDIGRYSRFLRRPNSCILGDIERQINFFFISDSLGESPSKTIVLCIIPTSAPKWKQKTVYTHCWSSSSCPIDIQSSRNKIRGLNHETKETSKTSPVIVHHTTRLCQTRGFYNLGSPHPQLAVALLETWLSFAIGSSLYEKSWAHIVI